MLYGLDAFLHAIPLIAGGAFVPCILVVLVGHLTAENKCHPRPIRPSCSPRADESGDARVRVSRAPKRARWQPLKP